MKACVKNLFLLPVLLVALGLIPVGRVTAQIFTTLHSFTATSVSYRGTNIDGAYPQASLVLLGNTLYGTASYGGQVGNGKVFAVKTDGTGFTNLHTFTKLLLYPPYLTNTDGANPYEGLIISGDTLYGTAAGGGSSGNGTVFAVSTDGTGFTNLHAFTTLDQTYGTNSDGATPTAGLVLSGNTLYGTATYGGSWGYGT